MAAATCPFCKTARVRRLPDRGGRTRLLNAEPVPRELAGSIGWAVHVDRRARSAWVVPVTDVADRLLDGVAHVMTEHICAERRRRWYDRRLRLDRVGDLDLGSLVLDMPAPGRT